MRAIRFDEGVLDDPERIDAADQTGTLRAIATAGAQIRQAATVAGEAGFDALRDDGRPRALVVVASGADEVVGDIVGAVAGYDTAVPVVLVKDGVLPGWVGSLDLVIVCDVTGQRARTVSEVSQGRERAGSESAAIGRAETDTVDIVSAAGRRGCRMVDVTPPRTPLAETAIARRALLVPIDPAGRPPGTNVWLLAVPALLAAAAAGVIAVPPALDDVADLLDDLATRCRPSQEPFVNPAKDLALGLLGDLPLLWATGQLAAVAARRFAARLAALAGYPAVSAAGYEVTSAALGLLDGPFARSAPEDIFLDPELDEGAAGGPRLHVVLLHDGVLRDGSAEAERVETLRGVVNRRGVLLRELAGEGRETLARLASLVCLGDFAAAYLAVTVGREPVAAPALLEYHERPDRSANQGT